MSEIIRDVGIIGAGPAGLFAAFECGMLGYKSVIFDSLPQAGGQLTELYPDKPIYDIPCFPHVLAGEVAARLIEQAKPFDPIYQLGEQVSGLVENADGTFTITAGDAVATVKAVIIAAGGGMFAPRKPAGIENLAEFEGQSCFYAVKDKSKFADKTIVIAGGGDSAVDWAVNLAPLAKEIHVVHRRADFRAAPETVSQMEALAGDGNVTIHTPYQLKELVGENGHLNQITLTNATGELVELTADTLLCFYGLKPELGPIADWQLDLSKNKLHVAADTMLTNRAGIMAIGDICDYAGKLNLILTGFAEAAIAAKTVQGIIDPDKKFKLIYSTSKGVPGA